MEAAGNPSGGSTIVELRFFYCWTCGWTWMRLEFWVFSARKKEGGANEKEGEERERLVVGYGTAGLLLLANYLIKIREGKLWL
jgi:hypothetical protein